MIICLIFVVQLNYKCTYGIMFTSTDQLI